MITTPRSARIGLARVALASLFAGCTFPDVSFDQGDAPGSGVGAFVDDATENDGVLESDDSAEGRGPAAAHDVTPDLDAASTAETSVPKVPEASSDARTSSDAKASPDGRVSSGAAISSSSDGGRPADARDATEESPVASDASSPGDASAPPAPCPSAGGKHDSKLVDPCSGN
jgi:hypothetical protein